MTRVKQTETHGPDLQRPGSEWGRRYNTTTDKTLTKEVTFQMHSIDRNTGAIREIVWGKGLLQVKVVLQEGISTRYS